MVNLKARAFVYILFCYLFDTGTNLSLLIIFLMNIPAKSDLAKCIHPNALFNFLLNCT